MAEVVLYKYSSKLRFKDNVTETSFWPGIYNYLDENIHQTASTSSMVIYLSQTMQMVLHMMEQHEWSCKQNTLH